MSNSSHRDYHQNNTCIQGQDTVVLAMDKTVFCCTLLLICVSIRTGERL